MSSRTDAWLGVLAMLQLAGCSLQRSSEDLVLRKDDRGKRLSMDEVSGYPDAAPAVRRVGALTAGNVVEVVAEGRSISLASPIPPQSGQIPPQTPIPTQSAQIPPKPEGRSVGQFATARPPHALRAPAGLNAPAGSMSDAASCRALVAPFVESYKKLYAAIPQGMYHPDGAGVDRLLAATPRDCDDALKRRATVDAVLAGLDQHSGKIGVILPLTGTRAKYANYVVQGLRAALAENHLKMEDAVVLKDSAGQAQQAEARLAELVFHDKISLVIGGMEKSEADLLAQWSRALALPAMLLTRDRDVTSASPSAFRVYPDEKRLAGTLVEAAVKRGLKRIAIVRPDNHKSDKITDYFRKALAQDGGTVAFDLTYTPGSLDSMMAIGRQLFQIDAADRREEFQKAYKQAKEQAEADHEPFNAKMVVLKPIVQFDAVFLPDDFRTVRHFAKLFKFNMVDKLTMIGNHEWRSEALVEPWDPFLEGSIFADFIGSYAKLPAGLATETVGSPYFVRPQQVVVTDFNLIGYRVGKAARMTIDRAGRERRSLAPAALALTSEQAAFFGAGKVFDDERQSNWPTYLFAVAKGRIVLEQEGTAAGVAAKAPVGGKY